MQTWTVISHLPRHGRLVNSAQIAVLAGRHRGAVCGEFDGTTSLHIAEVTAETADTAARQVYDAFQIVGEAATRELPDLAGYDRWTVIGFTAGGDSWSCRAVIGGEHQLADRWDSHAMYSQRAVFVVDANSAEGAREEAYRAADRRYDNDWD